MDELYRAVILNPYIALSRFLADVIDWRFWHDWFHDDGDCRRFPACSPGLLAVQVDLGVIDAIANGLGTATQALAGSTAPPANRFCAQLCPVDVSWVWSLFWDI